MSLKSKTNLNSRLVSDINLEHQFISKISLLCPIFFKNSEIIYENNDNYITFKIYVDKFFCISFSNIDNVSIEIVSLKKCSLSGKENLENLELLARNLGYIKYLFLEDQSTIYWTDLINPENIINIDLSLLCIMTKENSYYNSLGYFQQEYDNEKLEWNIIRNMNFYDYLENIQYLDYDSYSNIKSIFFHNGLELFSTNHLNRKINENNFNDIINQASDFIVDNFNNFYGNFYEIKTVKNYELSTLIYSYIKNNIQIPFIEKIYHYLIISLFGLSIEYSRDNLIKYL